MSSLQRRLDQEASTFPVQDDIWPGESGQGYVLRMCAQNGLGGVTRVKDMLGITRYQTLDAQAASQSPMARSNSPTLGHPKFPQAGRPDYDDSGVMAMRAAASLRR